MSIGGVAAAVLGDVFKPLDVRLGVAVDLADEAGVLPDVYSGVGWEASLENGAVRGPLCRERGGGNVTRMVHDSSQIRTFGCETLVHKQELSVLRSVNISQQP